MSLVILPMEKLVLFAILSLPVLAISWRSLSSVHNHGFYRFFGWEGILWLIVSNYKYWFTDPFSTHQMISWVLLINGGYLVIAGIIVFVQKGKIDRSREEKALFGFEKTTRLIDTGVYRHIRHPLYASLIYLTWGICFKNPTPLLVIISLVSSVLFYLTSRYDEKECIAYFGDEYREYMTRSKMFVPFIF
jgi:protein-S-isoprenylcysteine O-methyltransferase Ste14